MSPVILGFIGLCVFLTSMLSGVFGMAGGIVLMAVLLAFFPVAAAMALHSSIQMVANGWRCWIWRGHIVWAVLPYYCLGIAIGLGLIALVRFVPDKAAALIIMGAAPLVAMAMENHVRLSILNRVHTVATSVILTFIHMTAGIIGPLLDLLYVNAPLTRQQIIATKAFTQTVLHILRFGWYGALIPMLWQADGWPVEDVPVVWWVGFLVLSVAGTSAASVIVKRMNDRQFKAIVRWLIVVVCTYSLVRGGWMMAVGG
jgi:uncharacterized membrane protein YfcA